MNRIWKSLKLWFALVGRVNQAGYRTGPLLAMELVWILKWKYRRREAELRKAMEVTP